MRGFVSLVFALSVAAIAAGMRPRPADAQQVTWETMPRMQLERQFAGPLKDTVIQRWRDPGDGTICYVYLPITAPHSPPVQGGYVQYGANTIGSISCVAAPQNVPAAAVPRAAPAPPPKPAAPSQAPRAPDRAAPGGSPPQ